MVQMPAADLMLGIPTDRFADHQAACETTGSSRCTEERFVRESPAMFVWIESVWVDQTEVSRAQYQRCVRSGACPAIDESKCQIFDGEDWQTGRQLPLESTQDDVPRTCVTHAEARLYCAWAGARLPTEAEWELAATGEEGRIFAWGDDFAPAAVSFVGHTPHVLDPVNSRPTGRTPSGIYHLSGNAYEWVADPACDYSDWSVSETPCQSDQGRGVVRGGSFASDGGGVRTTYRRYMDSTARIDTNGFRCVMDELPSPY